MTTDGEGRKVDTDSIVDSKALQLSRKEAGFTSPMGSRSDPGHSVRPPRGQHERQQAREHHGRAPRTQQESTHPRATRVLLATFLQEARLC